LLFPQRIIGERKKDMEVQPDNKDSNQTRTASNWASPVSTLKVTGVSSEAINLNVNGRKLTGPLQGFGQLWQKTYKVRLSGSSATPEEVIARWRSNFPVYWPKGNRFYAPLTRIEPGNVAVLNLDMPGGMALSTGIIVIYADERSFSFMCPMGHMFGGMITFSADSIDGATVAQAQVLIRANDPLWEVVMRLGGFRKEDNFWQSTVKNLAADFGVTAHVQQETTLVDPRLQWSEAKNIWYNAAVRSTLYTFTWPIRRVGMLIPKKDKGLPG
jgi:hypothetical protein